MSEVLGETSERARAGDADAPAAVEARDGIPEPAVQSSGAGEDLLPIRRTAWEKLLQQLGNLHESGQQ
ncbi:MAG TPA: hypothetical protein VLT15_04515, partial [Acidimicrobiia bacterium]|nr:hypothetical protein [Acidimicrobiia bacterium]